MRLGGESLRKSDPRDAVMLPRGASFRVRPAASRRLGKLLVQRLTVSEAAAKELRPIGHFGEGVRLLRQQGPQSRMMPAKIVTAAVSMIADTASQPLHLGDQLVARHAFEIVVHSLSLGL